jgi:hypothetical protein
MYPSTYGGMYHQQYQALRGARTQMQYTFRDKCNDAIGGLIIFGMLYFLMWI